MQRIKSQLILSIIPFIVILGSYLILKDLSAFYLSWFDPAYVYLFNGLNLAQGSLEIGHIDHPGTPLQIYCAIVIKIVSLFKNDVNIVESVLSEPEFYLYAISYSLILLNSIILFILGHVIFKLSNNLSTAVFLQLSPLVSLKLMLHLPVVASESVLFGTGIIMVLLIFSYTFYYNQNKSFKFILGFSIVTALSLAVKISSFPIIIIPLFILNNGKSRLQYLLLTGFFFILFILPIIDKIGHHYQFILNILTHTGIYGSGNAGFINLSAFSSNLVKIFTTEFPFSFSYLIILMVSVLMLFKVKTLEAVSTEKRRLIYSIFIATSLQILMVAKHYKFHYLIPVYSFSILGLYLVGTIYIPLIKRHYEKISNSKCLSVGLIVVVVTLTVRLYFAYNFYPNLNNPINTTLTLMEKYNKLPRVILTDGIRESAYTEPALNFGLAYSGKLKGDYAKYLKKIYPNSYFYSLKDGMFNWQNFFMNEEILGRYPKLLIYARDRDTLRVASSLKTILNNSNKYISLTKIFSNYKTYEHIYQLSCDTGSINQIIKPVKEIYCDMELVDKGKKSFVDKKGEYFFKGVHLQNKTHSVSGNNSVKLTKELSFGMETSILVKKGSFIKIFVWRYSITGQGVLVASSNDVAEFYKSSSVVIEKEDNGWELLELSFYVPKNLNGNQLNIYLWNNGNEDVFFDDLQIKEFTIKNSN
ncbi:MAG: hypothetical protein DRI95_07935 [Bacteroidetes bacterium]|nr:MAG: hypothetical protein DRI95_07935 [Bacteroidota bacterium]